MRRRCGEGVGYMVVRGVPLSMMMMIMMRYLNREGHEGWQSLVLCMARLIEMGTQAVVIIRWRIEISGKGTEVPDECQQTVPAKDICF